MGKRKSGLLKKIVAFRNQSVKESGRKIKPISLGKVKEKISAPGEIILGKSDYIGKRLRMKKVYKYKSFYD